MAALYEFYKIFRYFECHEKNTPMIICSSAFFFNLMTILEFLDVYNLYRVLRFSRLKLNRRIHKFRSTANHAFILHGNL